MTRRGFALVELPLMIAALCAFIGFGLVLLGWYGTGVVLIVGGLMPWLLLFALPRGESGGVYKKERI